MGVIATVEDAIIAEAKERLQNKIASASSLPGPWSIELLKRLMQEAPGVYVSLTSGKESNKETDEWIFQPSFDVYFVAKNASGEEARRRGDSTAIGAYEMIETLGPYLNGLPIDGVGDLQFAGLQNLFGEAMFDIGGTIYALNYRIKNILIKRDSADFDALSQFTNYTADHLRPGGTGNEPDAKDSVTLEQS